MAPSAQRRQQQQRLSPLLLAALLLLCALGLPAAVRAAAPAAFRGNRVLVLLGSDSLKASHGKFLQALRDAGLELDVRGAKDDGLALREYDAWRYDHLVLLAPKASGLGGELSRAAVLDFVDAGGNVLLALAPGASDAMRALAAECGVEVDAKGTLVHDHFSRQAAGGAADATLVATSAWVDSDAILGPRGERPNAPVLFRGVAQVAPTGAELVTVALSGSPTAYSHDPKRAPAEPPALPVGGAAALVTLVQARNNARVAVVGSLDMLSDELFDAPVTLAETGESFPKSGNRAFAVATALWTFQRRGVLEASEPRHRRLAPSPEEAPPLYRVNDEVEFEIDVFEVAPDGSRKPAFADGGGGGDGGGAVQLSFVMLDPHVRQPLEPLGNGTLRLRFTVPDVYGVFKYSLDHAAAGYSYLTLQRVVPVRPFKHDEYDRFLVAAYPYYASALSTMAAFFVAGLAFLYSGGGTAVVGGGGGK